MSNVVNISNQTPHSTMNGGGGGGVIIREATVGGLEQTVVVNDQQIVKGAGTIIQQATSGSNSNQASDIDGNFIREYLGMHSQGEMVEQQQQQQILQLQQQAQQVMDDGQQQQQPQQQIQIQNASQDVYEIQENDNHKVILVSELFKCDICNLAFIFKEHYIQHCDDHIRMVAEHINLSGIVPINTFDESNEVLDFRNDNDPQQQQQAQHEVIVQNHSNNLNNNNNNDSSHGNSETGTHAVAENDLIQVHQHSQQQHHHHHHQEVVSDNNHRATAMDDMEEDDGQLTHNNNSLNNNHNVGSGSGHNNAMPSSAVRRLKKTSQQQMQASLTSEWCKCLPCDFKFRTPLSLSRHLNAHMENRNRCNKCNKYFTSYVSLRTHHRMHDAEGSPESVSAAAADLEDGCTKGTAEDGSTANGPKVFVCKKCNMQFSNATQYRDHKLTHPNDVYTCNECHKAFLSIINLNRHRQSEHQQRETFLCLTCNCEFTNQPFLEEHNKTRSHLYRNSPAYYNNMNNNNNSSSNNNINNNPNNYNNNNIVINNNNNGNSNNNVNIIASTAVAAAAAAGGVVTTTTATNNTNNNHQVVVIQQQPTQLQLVQSQQPQTLLHSQQDNRTRATGDVVVID